MKKYICGLLSLLLLVSLASVMSYPTLSLASPSGTWPRFIDEADLLTAEEEESLLARLDEVSTQDGCDVIIVTRNELVTGDVQREADDIYDEAGYGQGEEHSGILLLVSMADRDWAISTCGYGITVFTDEAQSAIMGSTLPYLSDGEYARAFKIFAVLCGDQLERVRSDPYWEPEIVDGERTEAEQKFDIKTALAGSLVIGLIAAWISTAVMKSKLKSVRGQASAGDYVVRGSFALTDRRDMFLYHTVNRTRRENQSSGGGRSGHSTVHTSSSGRSHGGSHGKF